MMSSIISIAQILFCNGGKCLYRKSNLSLSNRGWGPYNLSSGGDICMYGWIDVCMLEWNLLTGLVFCRFICLFAWWFCVPHACCMLSLGPWYLRLFSRNSWFPAAVFITALKESRAVGSWAGARHTLGTDILLTQTNNASVFYLPLHERSHAHTHALEHSYVHIACQCCGLFRNFWLKGGDYCSV